MAKKRCGLLQFASSICGGGAIRIQLYKPIFKCEKCVLINYALLSVVRLSTLVYVHYEAIVAIALIESAYALGGGAGAAGSFAPTGI